MKEWRINGGAPANDGVAGGGGLTDIDNLVLLCSYHHARFAQQGWEIIVHDGIPWFIPPPLIDRDRTPIRNIRSHGANPFDP